MKTNMNWFSPCALDPELLAVCPPLEADGKIVAFNGKRYYLRRTVWDHKEVVFVKRIKK